MSGGGPHGRPVEHPDAIVERKSESLPRFVVVPEAVVAPWELDGTTMVEVRVGDHELGRRSLKPWPERGGWFFDLTEFQAKDAGVATGDRVRVTLELASTELPEELQTLLDGDAEARHVWKGLTDARRRMIAEQVRSAVKSETRKRRAEKALQIG